jgi:glutamate/tyrosine decarboxylase-like PLP-dependent enzyme
MDHLANASKPVLPAQGRGAAEVQADLIHMLAADRAAIASVKLARRFFGGEDVFDIAARACGIYAQTGRSALYPGMPGAAAMEFMQRRILEVALDLLRAPDGAAGLITSGGTESVIVALKACVTRAAARGLKRQDMYVIAPRTAHPCIDKAAELLGIRLQRVAVKADGAADIPAMRAALTSSTVMLYGSYPCYAYGTCDDIAALGALAAESETWLHVDACMSGFLAPFAKMNGEVLPDFDFSIPGVTSVSADLHKHGYSAKGASLVLFRTAELAQRAAFEYADHPLPPMRTPTLAGTASGAPIASAWAAFEFLGVDGYRDLARRLFDVRRAIVTAVGKAAGFAVIGEPLFSLVVITSRTHDMVRVREWLNARHWFTLPVMDPPGIHLNLGAFDHGLAVELARDLNLAVENVH